MKEATQKIILISGTTSGIGKELKALYRAAGDTVIGLARTADPADGDIAVDVTDFAEVVRVVDGIINKYGRIDTVIANAGGGLSGATELLPLDEVQKQIDLNFTGALNLARVALKGMTRGGKVVFISSACALFALPYRATYCASKAAINMAAFGLYMELKNSGIRVSSICPGDIKTSFTKNRVKYSNGGERYGDAPVLSAQKIDGRENKRMALKPAAKKIYKCAVKCKKPLYIIGFKYKALNFLRHVLPQKLFLDVTAKLF
ncbi:MAG: SDR family NAD(P)-dependent oxidoreductase [Clostridiales bacterium]|nr:SDR family NAD(P)-dependent oxidoreductase [Clostridiales bacterium]